MLASGFQWLNMIPWWVYALLAYMVSRGILASTTRVLSLKRLLIMPSVFLILSVETLLTTFIHDPISVGLWVISIVLGLSGGFFQVYRLAIEVDREKYQVKIPGTWSILALMIIIFSAKFYFGYTLAVNPGALNDEFFKVIFVCVSGACAGLFVGRVVGLFYKFNATRPMIFEQK